MEVLIFILGLGVGFYGGNAYGTHHTCEQFKQDSIEYRQDQEFRRLEDKRIERRLKDAVSPFSIPVKVNGVQG